jgi:hypothetical protein
MDDERGRGGKVRMVFGVEPSPDSPASRKILWGLFLMVLGGALLLGQLGLVAMPSLWKLWPTVLLVMAAGCLLERRAGTATYLAFVGLSFFAAQFHWFGLSYRTFWPLLVVAVGVWIVASVLSGEDACAQRGA